MQKQKISTDKFLTMFGGKKNASIATTRQLTWDLSSTQAHKVNILKQVFRKISLIFSHANEIASQQKMN